MFFSSFAPQHLGQRHELNVKVERLPCQLVVQVHRHLCARTEQSSKTQGIRQVNIKPCDTSCAQCWASAPPARGSGGLSPARIEIQQLLKVECLGYCGIVSVAEWPAVRTPLRVNDSIERRHAGRLSRAKLPSPGVGRCRAVRMTRAWCPLFQASPADVILSII